MSEEDDVLVDAYDGVKWYRGIPMRLVRLAWASGHQITIVPSVRDKDADDTPIDIM